VIIRIICIRLGLDLQIGPSFTPWALTGEEICIYVLSGYRLVPMANEESSGNATLQTIEQKLREHELALKEIYAQTAATALPTPEQIQNFDCLKETNRVQIEKICQSIQELE
jgi:hypothetical protein